MFCKWNLLRLKTDQSRAAKPLQSHSQWGAAKAFRNSRINYEVTGTMSSFIFSYFTFFPLLWFLSAMWYTRLEPGTEKKECGKTWNLNKVWSLDNSNMFLVLPKVSQVMQDVTLEKIRLKKKTSWRAYRTLCTMCAIFLQIWNYSTIKGLFNKFTTLICDKNS